MSTQELQNGNPLVFVTIHLMRNKGPKSRHFTGEFKKILWTSNSNGLFEVEGVRGYVGQPGRIRGERDNKGHKRSFGRLFTRCKSQVSRQHNSL